MNARLDSGRTSQSRPLAPRRVLVVDDNVDVVETLVLLLRQMGHDAEFALNGQGAIDTARRSFRNSCFSTWRCREWTATK
jgi:DNA-binding NtrC family response regulator